MDAIKLVRLIAAFLLTLLGIVYLALIAFSDYVACLEIEETYSSFADMSAIRKFPDKQTNTSDKTKIIPQRNHKG